MYLDPCLIGTDQRREKITNDKETNKKNKRKQLVEEIISDEDGEDKDDSNKAEGELPIDIRRHMCKCNSIPCGLINEYTYQNGI